MNVMLIISLQLTFLFISERETLLFRMICLFVRLFLFSECPSVFTSVALSYTLNVKATLSPSGGLLFVTF